VTRSTLELADQARSPTPAEVSTAIVEHLKRREAYKERPAQVEMRETHISWVFLTDRFAYKLKKPVRFDFLDFSTADARRAACEAELRLNSRLARGVYLRVLPITSTADGKLAIDGRGAPVDWVVKMRRLPDDCMLDALIRKKSLTAAQVDDLAAFLAKFYHGLSPLTTETCAYRQMLEAHVRANRVELLRPSHVLPEALTKRVHAAQQRCLLVEGEQFEGRVCDGRIVEGHGDLRPEHICLEAPPAIFDCIEFNAEFRRLDAADELAFLAMECDRLDADWAGRRIVEAYRQKTADYFSPTIWNFYKCYRACVRAKVAALRAAEGISQGEESVQPSSMAVEYLRLADLYAAQLGPPAAIVVSGLMGSGKTTLAEALADSLGAELIQTDRVRREVFGASPEPAKFEEGVYRPENRQRVYEEVLRRAEQALDQGLSVILDGAFLAADQRRRAWQITEAAGAMPLVFRCVCPPDVARDRLTQRLAKGATLSEARADLYDLQSARHEPDLPGFVAHEIDTTYGRGQQIASVAAELRRMLNQRLRPSREFDA
jgi:aminoglycoside phosphotransferase family enzyme/predicted kinase